MNCFLIRVVDIILKHANEENIINSKDKDNHTPLSIAALNGHEEVVRLLVTSTADVNPTFSKHPLQCASINGSAQCVDILLKCGAPVNSRFKNHETSLHLASHYGNLDVVRLLLKRGANVMLRDLNGLNALNWAIGNYQQ